MTETLTAAAEWTSIGGDWHHKQLPDGSYLIVQPHWDDPGWIYIWKHRGPDRENDYGPSVVHAEGQAVDAEQAMLRADECIAAPADRSTKDTA
jgi:hypothetical protein